MADEDIESGGQTDDTGDTGVDETDDTSTDDTAAPVAAKDDGAAVPRKQRRVHHMRAAAEAKAAAERERDELRQRIAQMEQDHRETRQRIEQQQTQARQQDTTSQTKEKVAALRRQAKTHLAMSAQLKGDAAEREWAEYERLQDEANDLRDEMRDADRWAKRQGEIQQQMPNQEVLAERQYLEAKYPAVVTSLEGRSLADARFNSLVRNGRPSNRATMEEAITYAAKTLRLGGNSSPSDASRQRYAGFAGRDGEADDGASSGSMSADEVKNDLALKRMALGLFREDDPEVAYAKFAKQIGSKAKQQAR